jgi:hypothetical protein
MRSPLDMSSTELEAEVGRLGKEVTRLECELGEVRGHFQAYSAELAKRRRPAPEPRLSDHALLRYLERVKGVDVEGARREIMTPGIIAAVKAMATSVLVNGAKFLVREGTIVTIMEVEKKPRMKCHDRVNRDAEAV